MPWAGRFNAISAAADLHLQEVRWLKTRQYSQDYARYWMTDEGAQPRNYGFAAAWSTWQMGQAQGDQAVAVELLDAFVRNYAGWEFGVVD